MSDARLVELGVPVVAHRGRMFNIRARWLVSSLVFAAGIAAVTASARVRGRTVELWVPMLIVGVVVAVFAGLHVVRILRLGDELGDDAILVGWCLGGFEVSQLLTPRSLPAVGRVNSAIVGLYVTADGVAVLVDRGGMGPWQPSPSDGLAVGTDGSRRWLLLSAGGTDVEQRLFRAVRTNRDGETTT